MYIAVIVNNLEGEGAKRTGITASTKDAAVKQAIRERETWERKNSGYGPYQIFVGELTERVETPVSYELVKIAATV